MHKLKGQATDVWYLRYWDADDNLVRRSSGTQKKDEAAAMLAEAEAEVARQKRANSSRRGTYRADRLDDDPPRGARPVVHPRGARDR
jgi:hypothetical protein